MGNCGLGSHGARKPEDIVDLDSIILQTAKENISTGDLSIAERLCVEKSIYLEVGWNYVDFTHKLSKFGRPKESIPSDFRNVTLFRTKFVNNSRIPQQYTFRTERQTKSTCSLSVQKGFTLGGTLNLEFALPTSENAPVNPEVTPCKISGGLSGQMSWSKTKGETHEEVLTWSVDSQVKVEPNKTAWAALVVHEEKLDVDFQLISTLKSRLKNNKIPVMVRRRKDKSLLEVLDIPVADVAFKPGTEKLRPSFHYDDNLPDRLQITTEGTCKAVYGVEQVIQIETRPLWPSDDISASLGALHLDPSDIKSTFDSTPIVIEDVTNNVTESTPLQVAAS